MLATERGLPVGDPGERGASGKRQYVRDMFTAIAPRYDFLNHLLSLNIDRRWRREAVVLLDWQRYRRAAPAAVNVETEEMIEKIVSGGYRGEHVPHVLPLPAPRSPFSRVPHG